MSRSSSTIKTRAGESIRRILARTPLSPLTQNDTIRHLPDTRARHDCGMNKTLATITLAALSAAALSSGPAVAAPPNASQMTKIAYMIGTWDCKWKAGLSSGTLVATFTPVMDGAWL